MSIKKYTDWSNWWDGLRTNLIKCVGTTGTSWIGSITVDAIHIPGMPHIGLDWRQAVGLFSVHLGSELFSYMKSYQPKVIVVETNTGFITKSVVEQEKVNDEKTNPPTGS